MSEARVAKERRYWCKACGFRFRSRGHILGEHKRGQCPRCSQKMVVRRNYGKFILRVLVFMFLAPIVIYIVIVCSYYLFF
ncbi:MAG: hypothetical protein ACFFBI_12705 [Promethearchaeota archaeon]